MVIYNYDNLKAILNETKSKLNYVQKHYCGDIKISYGDDYTLKMKNIRYTT